jgi:AraC-like DNA-binding protein
MYIPHPSLFFGRFNSFETHPKDLSALAYALGYSSHSHFTQAFKRAFGRPPSEVRTLAPSRA